jgi:uncharacterized protein (TIGR04255 family)
MTMRRTYAKPPIQEAVCEIVFADGEWTFGSAAEFYMQVKERYNAPPTQLVDSGLQLGEEQGKQTLTFASKSPRTRFSSADGSALITVGERLLAIHALPPYSGWEVFRKDISDALNCYADVTKSQKVVKIGVRYINRLNFEDSDLPLADYFHCAPRVPDDPFNGMNGFFERLELAVESSPAKVVLIFASVEAEEPFSGSVMLDLDVIRSWEEQPLEMQSVMEMVESLRALERDSFEALITDKLRERFDDD